MYGEENQKEGVRAIRVLVHDLGNLSWGENLSADVSERPESMSLFLRPGILEN